MHIQLPSIYNLNHTIVGCRGASKLGGSLLGIPPRLYDRYCTKYSFDHRSNH